jgi:pro-apoptotic serine protease NMA111
VVSRVFVPHEFCDITITIAESILVEGKVIFLHPEENYAILQYDSSLVEAPIQTPRLSHNPIQEGSDVVFAGVSYSFQPVVSKTTIASVRAGTVNRFDAPRYQVTNPEFIRIDTNLPAPCSSGVLMGHDGVVQALWLLCVSDRDEASVGLLLQSLASIISQIRGGVKTTPRLLSMEVTPLKIHSARTMGVSEHWIQKVAYHDPFRHPLYMVSKPFCVPVPEAPQRLQHGDILLTINGNLITSPSQLGVYSQETLDAVIVRDKKELALTISTTATTDIETSRVLYFCGAVIQRPHYAVYQQAASIVHSEVYVSATYGSSPADYFDLSPSSFITEVNGSKTPNLDVFIEQVVSIPDNVYFSVHLVGLDDKPLVITMKKNDHYVGPSSLISIDC